MLLGDCPPEPVSPSPLPSITTATATTTTTTDHTNNTESTQQQPQQAEYKATPPPKGLDVLHATSAALIHALRDVLIDSDFENAMKALTAWIPVRDEDLLMKVANAEWRRHRARGAKLWEREGGKKDLKEKDDKKEAKKEAKEKEKEKKERKEKEKQEGGRDGKGKDKSKQGLGLGSLDWLGGRRAGEGR